MKIEEVKLRQRVLLASEQDKGVWLPCEVLGVSSVTGLVLAGLVDGQAHETWWVEPTRLKESRP